MRNLLTQALRLSLFGATTLLGCGGDRSCEELCAEAQAGSCTTISGSCAAFCAAIDNSQARAGCESEVSTYLECQNASGNVCDEPSCSAEESAVGSCYLPFCTANPDDPDCATLVNSF